MFIIYCLHLTKAEFDDRFIFLSKYSFVLFCFVLFFFSSSLPFRRLSSTLGPISGDGFRQYKQMIFFLADTPQKVDNIHRAVSFLVSSVRF